MSAADIYIRSEAVVSRLIGGETLVVPVRGGVGDLASIYSFNEIGTMIWEALASFCRETGFFGSDRFLAARGRDLRDPSG